MTHRLARSLLVLASLGLSGCAAFSPDSGMNAVSELTSQTINKDVAFVRTAEGAGRSTRAFASCSREHSTPRPPCRSHCSTTRGLQAAYNELALAETDLVEQSLPPNPVFSISRISGNGAQRDRASGCRRHPRARHPAVPLGDRPRPFSPGAIARRRWRRCGLPPMSAAPIGAPSPATRWWRC